MKKYKLIINTSLLGILLSSCSDNIKDLNIDTKAYNKAKEEFLLTNAEVGYENYLCAIDVNSNNFRDYAQQMCNISYPQETNYEMGRRNLGGSAFSLYTGPLNDLEEAKKIINSKNAIGSIEIAEKRNKLAIIDIQQVMIYQTLVDLFGNIPYSQALNIESFPYPKFDDGLTIYHDLINRINQSVNQIDVTQNSFSAAGADIIYGSNLNKWIKLANSIKLKLGLHLADIEPAYAKTVVEEAAINCILNATDDALFLHSIANTIMWNPAYSALVNDAQVVGTSFIINELSSKSDPRLSIYFRPASLAPNTGLYVGATYGAQGVYGKYASPGTRLRSKTEKGIIWTYSENCFLLADAANRGFNVGGTASFWYDKGVRASLAYWGVSTTDANNYMARTDVDFPTALGLGNSQADNKKKIAYQLWLSYYNRGFEAWTEYKRLDYPNLVAPTTAVAAANNKVPVRLIYPLNEKIINATNYNQASSAIGGDLMTTKVFWDKF